MLVEYSGRAVGGDLQSLADVPVSTVPAAIFTRIGSDGGATEGVSASKEHVS
jgi:hypothetical protein